MLTALRLRLVDDWQQAWKWSSVRFAAAGGVVQAALLAFPAQLQVYLPGWLMTGLSIFSLAAVALTIAGRITTTELPSAKPGNS